MGTLFYKAQGVVLRLEPFGEAHVVVTLLTEERGRLRALAKGVRRPASRLARALLPFACCSVLVWKGRSLDGISQARVWRDFPRLRGELDLLTAASYLAEIAGEIVGDGDPAPEGRSVFRLLIHAFGALQDGADRELVLRYTELHLASLAGFRPQLAYCAACRQPLRGGGVFSPGRGLCRCLPCASRPDGDAGSSGGAAAAAPQGASPRDVRLSADALALAGFLLGLPASRLASVRVRAEQSALDLLGRGLRAHLEAVLDRRLKSARILDIIDTWPASGGR